MTGEENENTQETTITAYGNITPTQRGELLQVFAHFGIQAYVSTDSGDLSSENPVGGEHEDSSYVARFEDISSREQYFGYEHVYDFVYLHAQDLKPPMITRVATTVFAAVLFPKKPGFGQGNSGGSIEPRALGLKVASREDVEFPPVPKELQQRPPQRELQDVVEVGSFIDFAMRLRDPNFRMQLYRFEALELSGPKYVTDMATALLEQIELTYA